jgi:hemoglobin
VQAMDDAGLPGDPEFRAAMRNYMEVAVAEVLSFGDPGTAIPADAPMPHWGWHGPLTA